MTIKWQAIVMFMNTIRTLKKQPCIMAIQFFLAFIGSLLGCAIALAVVAKNLAEGIAVSGKKPFVAGSLTALFASFVAYLTSFISENPFEVFWAFGSIFLLLGIVHLLFLHNRYFYANQHNSNKVLIAELLFGLSLILFTIVVFSALQYFFKDRDFLFYPIVVSTLLFFVPVLVFHSFQAAYAIPPARFPTWQYPLHQPVEELPENDRNEHILVIGFEVAKKARDNRKTYFRVRAPETWQLGNLFYHFINEHNDPHNQTTIEYTDTQYEPYEWWFYKKRKWYQAQKILNPAFSVRENGITENTIIVCERNEAAAPLSNTYKK
jgi:hypothetical protein